MARIFKLTLLILLANLYQGCKKDDSDSIIRKEDSTFLTTREYIFRGSLPDSSIAWEYDIRKFNLEFGRNSTGVDDQERRNLHFIIKANRGLTRNISINTPDFSPQSNELFSNILTEGTKELGGINKKFELSITLDRKTYTTDGNQNKNALKIMKVEKITDGYNNDIALVWFKINCTFYSKFDSSSFTFKDGYLLAGFMYHI